MGGLYWKNRHTIGGITIVVTPFFTNNWTPTVCISHIRLLEAIAEEEAVLRPSIANHQQRPFPLV